MAQIIVIDDEPTVRRVLQKTLKLAGHDVYVAGQYREALDLLKQVSWDVALIDLVLGSDNGMDVLREARKISKDRPVLMITGNPTLDSAEEAIRVGAFDYIEKPFRTKHFIDSVNRALRQRQLVLERRRLEAENRLVRERLEAVFNSVLEGILTVDHTCNILTLNQAASSLLQLEGNERTECTFDTISRKGFSGIANAIKKSIRSGEYIREYQITEQTESREWTYVLSVTPLKANSDEGAVVVIRDVSRLRALEREVSEQHSFQNMIGKSPALQRVHEMIRDLADTGTTVLIQGASGTGKELVGAALHHHGCRKDGPLVKVNCAALPETLLESELFGHVKGAFTGATQDKMGRFELANGGTIFLDEIGDVSPHLQQRLLRVLQEREIERVGSTKTKKIDVRVVAATNRDLFELVSRGEFREDLYYRLNVVSINIPPLKDRREDIPLLVRHFLYRLQIRQERVINGIDPAVMEVFMRYDWPGNVRQLENALEHAVVLSRDGYVRLENLPPELMISKEITPKSTTYPMKTSITPDILRDALESTGWNRSRAARLLGVDRTTVWRKIKEFGFTSPED